MIRSYKDMLFNVTVCPLGWFMASSEDFPEVPVSYGRCEETAMIAHYEYLLELGLIEE